MDRNELLLKRLNEIGESLKKSGKARALIGLGSVGIELERLDKYSDLDFFAIVKDGYKNEFVDNISWLESVKPVIYKTKNTKDGYKVMFEDEIYAEFAVFELKELEAINFAEGRIVWKDDSFDENLRKPKNTGASSWKPESVEWVLGEILTCIYVGLCRIKRGEKLSGWRFIEGHAFSLLIELWNMTEKEDKTIFKDIYSKERRFEDRYKGFDHVLSKILRGYDNIETSAKEMTDYLDLRYGINKEMKRIIFELCK